MNLLLLRPLSSAALARVRALAPAAEIRQETDPAIYRPLLPWADVIFGNPAATEVVGLPRLRWLQIVSSGFDEYQALRGAGVQVTTAHGVHASAIAQQAAMAMLMFARGQLYFGAAQRAARWDRNPSIPFRLAGQTVGLVGYGMIGQEMAKLANAFGCRVIAVKAFPGALSAGAREPGHPRRARLPARGERSCGGGVTPDPFHSEPAGCWPHRTDQGGGLFFTMSLAGGSPMRTALLGRLRDGSLGGAALDVFAREPLPPDSPWWTAPNTVVFPHIAGHHRDLGEDTFDLFAGNLKAYVAGQPLRNLADFERGY